MAFLFIYQMNYQKNIMNLALPAMVENFLQMLMGVVDNYLVAQVGIVAVSGVSVANNILAIYQAVLIALGSAVASLIAKNLGAKEPILARRNSWDALLLTLALTVLLGLFSIFAGSSLLSLLGTQRNVTQAGGTYLAIVGGGVLFLGLMTVLGNILRAQGRPKVSMYVSLFSNLLNALLSSIAIFVCHWGISGVAFSTVLSRLIGTLLLWSSAKLDVREFRASRLWNKALLNLALPASGERLMMRAGDVIIVSLIVGLGTKAVAGNAIGETLTQFNYMPGMGVATATVILVAHSLGQEDYQALRQIVRETYWLAAFLMLIVGGLIFLLGNHLSGLFTSDGSVIAYSGIVIFYSFVGSLITAGTLIYTAVWQGLGKANLPFYATSFGMWIIRIGLGYLLVVALGYGLSAVWLATLADNAFRFAFLYLRYKNVKFLKN
ncbi:MATE efflux family Na(+)/drug antiporter [Streptococcus criceti]|uniref:Probable multidrug resistance protein NorM n=2 Tax=Streptococcus criceti TaxID=1333 RepID=G5JQD4_STRCG|nr:MATE efflux family protein [Streptococcus criceti HS-6]SUN41961.1 MATE efflux family Na(+)/drug antiporter [Streptococcus criceti]